MRRRTLHAHLRATLIVMAVSVAVFVPLFFIARTVGDDWRARVERCVEQPVDEYISLECQVWMTTGTGGR